MQLLINDRDRTKASNGFCALASVSVNGPAFSISLRSRASFAPSSATACAPS